MKELILKTIVEGIGLGIILIMVCAIGIRKGAIGMVHLYDSVVQERCISLGYTTRKQININKILLKVFLIPAYLFYIFVCVYDINGAENYFQAFWQTFVILTIMNFIDRLIIDELWVGHTKCWIIPKTEDLMPYISKKVKYKKWLFSTIVVITISMLMPWIVFLFK